MHFPILHLMICVIKRTDKIETYFYIGPVTRLNQIHNILFVFGYFQLHLTSFSLGSVIGVSDKINSSFVVFIFATHAVKRANFG